MRRHLYHIILPLATAACGGYELIRETVPADGGFMSGSIPPLASAGADREVMRGYHTCLDGRGTTHPLGLRHEVRWDRVEGDPVYLSNATDPAPCFVAPLDEQELVFKLTADDGFLRTTDTVTLHVRKDPQRVAPSIQAGPDRYSSSSERAEAAPSDVQDQLGDGVTAQWERITPDPSPAAKAEGEPAEPVAAVFRLSGERDGLGSAPDYLVLWQQGDPDAPTTTAPVAIVEAPEVAQPGATLVLDVSKSSDTDGDLPRWRWEQVSGEPVQALSKEGARLELTAPSRPQELTFRIYARGDRLESAPAFVTVVVAPADGSPAVPAADPELDRLAHPGNWVRLDALGASPTSEDESSPDVSFTWEQTHGEPLELESYSKGRFVVFQAPETLAQLAFAVVATDGVTLSAPAVVRVDVVEAAKGNAAPDIQVCVSPQEPHPGEWISLTATALDPEGDRVALFHWLTPTLELSVVTDDAGHDAEPALLCEQGTLRVAEGVPDLLGLAVSQVGLLAPDSHGQVFSVHVEACDEHGACSGKKVELKTQEN